MKTVLITGVSGYIGGALATKLQTAGGYRVVGISRKQPDTDLGIDFVAGDFALSEDLSKLDNHQIDACVHLGAVTGGCSERDGIVVNGEGTRHLMQYLIGRGCRKFVLASSVALPGVQDPQFTPDCLPVPDEHPCYDKHGYGFSKHLMEEVTRYLNRQNPEIDVINFRLGWVPDFDITTYIYETGPAQAWGFALLAALDLRDAVEAFHVAVDAPIKPGVRVMNVVAPRATCKDPVPVVIRTWLPNADLDLSHYEKPGHEHDPVYAIDKVREELGFTPRIRAGTAIG